MFPNIEGIARIQYGNHVPNNGTEIVVHMDAPDGLSDWTNRRAVGLGFRFDGEVVKYACGNPGTGNPVIPAKYLPSHCTCTNVNTWSITTNSISGCPD